VSAAALSTSPFLFAAKNSITPTAAFDSLIEDFMKERDIPGGGLAVVKNRRLVYARGYGWADRDQKLTAAPESLFRLASVSKPITAVAVLKLVEQNRISLDERVFNLLALDTHVSKSTELDDRWRRVTLRHLLHHTGGWDRDKHAGDPMFIARDYLAKRFPDLPAGSPWAVIRFQLSQPLDFEPGTRYAYSGFGYCLLGRVIEKVTGQRYETFVQQAVLAPAGIKRMRIGRCTGRADGEVCYYHKTDKNAPSAINFDAMDSGGGWIGSVVDLGRFAAALDNPKRSSLLKRASFEVMYASPLAVIGQSDGDDAYYGCGWCVRPLKSDGKANYWHYGDLPGTDALLLRFAIGFSIAIVFNQRSDNNTLANTDMDAALKRAAVSVTNWPTKDLFHRYS
jgi:N-acyl-D-amino-acid deacylase